jgi:sortase A
MRNKRLLIGPMFLLVGLILVSIPIAYEWKYADQSAELENALRLLNNDFKPENLQNSSNSEEQLRKVLELEIPSIDLKQKVLGETTEENLKIALTQIKEDQIPGKGNFTIAGHRGYRGERHFRRLGDLQISEKVYLHDADKTYIYKVTSSEVIKPTEVEVLEDTPGKDEITLITCTLSGTARVAVKGILISTL